MRMGKIIKQTSLATGVLVAGLGMGATAQAASVYAVSINEITNFSMSFSGGSGSFGGFTSTTSYALTEDGGAFNMAALDAAASCIGCSYSNEFFTHAPGSDFAYGDSLIVNPAVTTGSGEAHAIAEAYATDGSGYAKGSNSLSGMFNIGANGTSVDFSFDANPYMEAFVTGGVNASTVMSMIVTIAGESLQPTVLAALNTSETIFGGNYLYDLPLTSFNLSTGPLSSGTYSIGIEMVQEVTVNAVPVPAAVWLFGSGLLGLIGVARRQRS